MFYWTQGAYTISHYDIFKWIYFAHLVMLDGTYPLMPAKNTITKAQYETLAALRYELRKFIHFSETAAQAAGITPQQHQALLAIRGFPGRDQVTVSELAERLQLRHHSAVGLVDRLVAEKFVSRIPSKEDRRQVFIQLTSRGKKTLENLSAMHHKQLKQLGPEFSLLFERFTNVDE
jgi:DNA-binding MarR family transcriptional regulator